MDWCQGENGVMVFWCSSVHVFMSISNIGYRVSFYQISLRRCDGISGEWRIKKLNPTYANASAGKIDG